MINSSRSAKVVREVTHVYQAVNRMQRQTRKMDMSLDDISSGTHRAYETIGTLK